MAGSQLRRAGWFAVALAAYFSTFADGTRAQDRSSPLPPTATPAWNFADIAESHEQPVALPYQ